MFQRASFAFSAELCVLGILLVYDGSGRYKCSCIRDSVDWASFALHCSLSLSLSLGSQLSSIPFSFLLVVFFSFLGKRQTPRIFATHRIAEALYCEDDVNTYNFNSVVPLSPSIRYIAIERATKRQEPRRKFVSFAIVVAVEVLRFILSFICCYCSFFFLFSPMPNISWYPLYLVFSLALSLARSLRSFWHLFYREWCMCAQFPSLVILTTYCQSLDTPRLFSPTFYSATEWIFSLSWFVLVCSSMFSCALFWFYTRKKEEKDEPKKK